MRTASLTAAVALAFLLAACGQKGPLVLPDAQHPRKKLGIPKPTAAPANRPATPAGAAPGAPALPPDSGGTAVGGKPGDAQTAPAPAAPAPQP